MKNEIEMNATPTAKEEEEFWGGRRAGKTQGVPMEKISKNND